MVEQNNHNKILEYMQNHPECAIYFQKEGVTETSAQFVVQISDLVGNDDLTWIDKRFKYRNMSTGEVKEEMFYDMYKQITLTNLDQLTGYECWVEVRSAGKQYSSSTEIAITKGDLHLEPGITIFQASGGTRGVALLMDQSIVSSFDVSAPNWITKIEKSATSFFMEAGPNNQKKRIIDNLLVKVYLIDGTTITSSAPIIQEAKGTNAWDGTKWEITGEVKIKDTGYYWNQTRTTFPKFILTVTNVEKNNFSIEIIETVDSQEAETYVGHYEGLSSDKKYAKIEIDDDGRLIYSYEYNASYYNLSRKEKFVLTHPEGEDEYIYGTYSYVNHWEGYGSNPIGQYEEQYGDLDCTGTLTGFLVTN